MTVKNAPFGVVDMGSNGIRFGIVTSLSRHLPVTYEERAPISLLEAAQGDNHVIPQEIINQVITSFKRFQTICQHEGVDPLNVKVIATEATRIAANSKQLLDAIFKATGWTVDILSKEREATISSMGIVGSFYNVNGLTMDLGGGSVELSYVTSPSLNTSPLSIKGDERPKKRLKTSASPVSLPYGAAVLRKRLEKCTTDKERTELHNEIVASVAMAKKTTHIPALLKIENGYMLYMNGGGFRALGYLSMSSKDLSLKKKTTYPIPIINGYSMTGKQLATLVNQYKDCDPSNLVSELKVFRISKRRAKMLPATCFLVSAIMKVIPIEHVFFSEGGARQGICYQMLSDEEKNKDPLLEGIKAYVSSSPDALSKNSFETVLKILKGAIPPLYLTIEHPIQLHRLLPAAVHLANLTTHYPKETKAFAAFHMPLASGPLANIPGLLHHERAALALILAYRQGGEVPDPAFGSVESLIGKHGTTLCKYVGRLMEIVFMISPRQPGLGVVSSGIQFKLVPEEESNSSDKTFSPTKFFIEQHYSCAKLEIVFPKKPCALLDAPSVLSVIEDMDKKVQSKKNDEAIVLDGKSRMFTINVIRN